MQLCELFSKILFSAGGNDNSSPSAAVPDRPKFLLFFRKLMIAVNSHLHSFDDANCFYMKNNMS